MAIIGWEVCQNRMHGGRININCFRKNPFTGKIPSSDELSVFTSDTSDEEYYHGRRHKKKVALSGTVPSHIPRLEKRY